MSAKGGGGGGRKMDGGGEIGKKRSLVVNLSKASPNKRSKRTNRRSSTSAGTNKSNQSIIPLDALVVSQVVNQMTTLSRLQLTPASRLFDDQKLGRNDVKLVIDKVDHYLYCPRRARRSLVRLTSRHTASSNLNSAEKSITVEYAILRQALPAFFAQVLGQVKRLWSIEIRYNIPYSVLSTLCQALDDHQVQQIHNIDFSNFTTGLFPVRLLHRCSSTLSVLRLNILGDAIGLFDTLSKCPSLHKLAITGDVSAGEVGGQRGTAFFHYLNHPSNQLRSLSLFGCVMYKGAALTTVPALQTTTIALKRLTINCWWLVRSARTLTALLSVTGLRVIRLVLDRDWLPDDTLSQGLRTEIDIILNSIAVNNSQAQLTMVYVYDASYATERLNPTTFVVLFDAYLELSSKHQQIITLEIDPPEVYANVAKYLERPIDASLREKFPELTIDSTTNGSVLIRRENGRILLRGKRVH